MLQVQLNIVLLSTLLYTLNVFNDPVNYTVHLYRSLPSLKVVEIVQRKTLIQMKMNQVSINQSTTNNHFIN